MEKRERFKRVIMFVAALIIMTLEVAAFAFVWFTFYNYSDVIGELYYRRGHWAILGIYALLLFLFSKIYGAFKVGYLRIMDVLYSQILSIICVNGITYIQLCLIGRWKFTSNLLPILWMTLADIILIIIWVFSTRYIYTKIYPPRQMIVVYGDRGYDSLVQKIESRKDKYNVSGTISIEEDEEAIKEKIREYEAVILCDIPAQIRNRLLKYCFDISKRCYTTPKLSDIIITGATKIHLFDTPLYLYRNRGLTSEQKLIKRIIDIVFSLLMLILASPLMLIITIIIKAYDGGPVFYLQRRLTLDGKEFKVYKFRSMRMDSEKQGARLAVKGDSRVTPFGRIMRNIHFDELPQIFNILKGDMSLVGPRPERPEIMAEYERYIPEFHYRLKVKAGLTGYAQVYGKYNTTPYDKLKLDLTYIENYSVWLDFKLLLLTFKVLFQKENTEGVETWQTTAVASQDDQTQSNDKERD